MAEDRPPTWKVWMLASRPHTLTASISPVLVGYALSITSMSQAPTVDVDVDVNVDVDIKTTFVPHSSILDITLQFAMFCMLIQLGTNLHNDYADFVKGADTVARVGQARATQKGWLTPNQTARGATITLVAALAVGMPLAVVFDDVTVDRWMVFMVLSSVFNAVAYTGGPYPLGYIGLGRVSIGYSGLGDIFVFLYFGLVATLTVPYLTQNLSCESAPASCQTLPGFEFAFVAAVCVGCLGTAIIVVNNLRDRHTDILAGKRTTAVRFGERFSRIQYGVLVLLPYAMLLVLRYGGGGHWGGANVSNAWLAPLVSLPLSVPHLRAVAFGGKDGADLNPHVGGTALLQFAYCVLLSTSLLLFQ
eukprot:CAMPEP_0194371782 /NCGR_PEP_ID=MMETSP0174-20130528/20184_1 /TAXON_ID=216777 /ORGANISM="Proboscia alata, Strain PI-D3" /LENGTH=360 /DNA_ID=CAMNT_0039150009 /DNA_START=83 /DNA_END=1165 /DNA_ORIENTATION=-